MRISPLFFSTAFIMDLLSFINLLTNKYILWTNFEICSFLTFYFIKIKQRCWGWSWFCLKTYKRFPVSYIEEKQLSNAILALDCEQTPKPQVCTVSQMGIILTSTSLNETQSWKCFYMQCLEYEQCNLHTEALIKIKFRFGLIGHSWLSGHISMKCKFNLHLLYDTVTLTASQ